MSEKLNSDQVERVQRDEAELCGYEGFILMKMDLRSKQYVLRRKDPVKNGFDEVYELIDISGKNPLLLLEIGVKGFTCYVLDPNKTITLGEDETFAFEFAQKLLNNSLLLSVVLQTAIRESRTSALEAASNPAESN